MAPARAAFFLCVRSAGANSFSGSSRRKSRVRIRSAGRRGQNRGCEFAQRVVAAKIAGANSFSGSSRPKSRVRICSAGRRGQNRGCEFVQRFVAAKIAGANSFSGSSRPKSRARIRSAARRGQNRGCEFVQQGVLRRGISHTPLKTLPASWPGFLEGALPPIPHFLFFP